MMFNLDQKLSNFIHKKKTEQEVVQPEDNDQHEQERPAINDIDLSGQVNPETQAKTLKGRTIMVIAACLALFAVGAVVTNFFFSGSPSNQKKETASLSTGSRTTNPAAGLPDKYSDIGKYEGKNDQLGQRAKAPKTNTPSNVKAGTDNIQSDNHNVTQQVASVPVNRSQQHNYSSPSVPAMPTQPAQTNVVSEAEREARARQQVIASALAFKMTNGNAVRTENNGKQEAVTTANTAGGNAVASYVPSATAGVSDSVFTLTAGTVIQATLLTGITSDVPNGDVVAQVRQNIYDSLTGEHLLIPQGSKLIGTSGAAGSRGNKRLGVVFTRIILPNGSNVYLPRQNAIDGVGYPGLSEKYDDHGSTLYRTAFMSALFAAAAQSMTGNTTGTDNRSPGQEAVSGAVASILQTAQSLINRDANVAPTITVSPGFQFSVFVNQDCNIGEYIDA
jgi:type IV secretory pathway VirB10-like protein